MRTATRLGIAALVLLAPGPAAAHGDALDGPVVAAAHRALAEGDVSIALVRVEPGAEAEVRAAFALATDVRGLAPPARPTWPRSASSAASPS
jgi:hypothetical protein